MAAGVSSPPRQAYLHHSLPTNSATTTTTLNNSCSTASSSEHTSVHEPQPSPSFSAATASTHSLSASDLRPSLSPSNTSSPFSTPALSPIPTHSPLKTVAESDSSSLSPPSSTSPSRHAQQQQPQLGANYPRGDSKTQRSGGFFAFAASAIDRTQSAIATISDPNIRHTRSLSRLSISGDVAAISRAAEPSPDKISQYRPASILPSPSSANFFSPVFYPKPPSVQALLAQEPNFSQRYSETDASQPPPILLPRIDNKMHQTSSRLLRMTDDDRPFTKVSRHLARYALLLRAVSSDKSSSSVTVLCAGTWRRHPPNRTFHSTDVTPAGLQRSLCDTDRQSATAVRPPCKIDKSRAHLSLGGCHQQLGLVEILPIQPHARPQRSFSYCDDNNHHDVFDGQGYGPFYMSALSGSSSY